MIIKYIYVWKIKEVVLSVADIAYTRIVFKGHKSYSQDDTYYRIVIVLENNNKEIEILESKNKQIVEKRMKKIKKFIDQSKDYLYAHS